MKKLNTLFIIAMALVIGLTQCKKNVETIEPTIGPVGEPVYITLNVGCDKHIVYPGTGVVVYAEGDNVYVGNDGKYIGTLTYHDGTFSGVIYGPETTDYLHFYFLGGLETGDINAGTTTEFAVSIANQSSSLPVLSYGHSTHKYVDGNTTYGCTLENQCALAKFTLTDSTSDTVTLKNVPTTAAISFTTPGITTEETTGDIKLYSETATSKWAILLPKATATTTDLAIDGFEYPVTVPAITANGYFAGDDDIDVVNEFLFSVSATKKVRFSPANLQYEVSTSTWSFMEHDYSRAEINGSISENYYAWGNVSLFAWGANGENGIMPNTYGDGWGGETIGDNDWANKANADSLGGHNDWFVLSNDEWCYLMDNHTHHNAYITVDDQNVRGVVILPDNSTLTINETYTDSEWNYNMKAKGAVFLPAAGIRNSTMIQGVGQHVKYWSSTPGDTGKAYAWPYVVDPRRLGHSVRLVR